MSDRLQEAKDLLAGSKVLNRDLDIVQHAGPNGLVEMHDLLTWAVGEIERLNARGAEVCPCFLDLEPCARCAEANAAYQASEPGPVEKQLEKLKAQAEDDRTACPVCRRGPHARWIVGPPYKPCAYCGLDGPGPWPELPITSPRAIVDRAALHLPLGWGDTRSEAAQ